MIGVAQMHTHIHACVHARAHTHACMHACTHTHTHTSVCAHTHCMRVHTFTHTLGVHGEEEKKKFLLHLGYVLIITQT